ncbi:MAG: aldehyde dehydrogenase family protein [Ignavibacteriales bacterium]|nr:aldehyde dehydrogenase family protein [Ignavibacteria bacterium]MBZ0195743.1 aldehyde dehydrogenase family protein [Ignavibacteriaceae bacterium]MCZ2143708.1 aldehyde dehydrogenase family protein [Ignavibacteriales bacterium]WKZ73667.1 MAG: aldehyde dehydrogenase family protein [Ignavibacteriaceae bacterium]
MNTISQSDNTISQSDNESPVGSKEQFTTKPEVTITYNPASGEKVGETPVNTVAELNQAVAEAKKAAKKWGALPFSERKRHLLKMRDYIVDNADRFAAVISSESGKTVFDAFSTEVMPSVLALNYYAKNAGRVLRRKRLKPGSLLLANKVSIVERVPYGVVGIISPWNYPFGIPLHEIAMALIAGNCVVLKAASQTQEVSKLLRETVEMGEIPEGVFTLVNIPGRIAGDAFIESGIDKLYFTGSVDVGKQLMKKAAERLLPVSLELGGNDAMIVLEDANIHRAVAGALWAGLSNSGQSCAGVERIYVHEKIYEDFVTELKRQSLFLRQGNGSSYDVEIGAMTTQKQLETVQKHLADAIDKGAKATPLVGVSTGEEKGRFHKPYAVEKVSEDMLLMKEETFGPLLGIDIFSTEEEAIAKANNSNLGLTASVWTRDRKRGREFARKLEAGTVTINDHLMTHGLAETPWGGFKESGLGRTHGEEGLLGMTQPHCIVDDILPGVQKNMWWYPHGKDIYDGLKGGIELLYAKSLPVKFDGAIKLIKTFFRTFRKN